MKSKKNKKHYIVSEEQDIDFLIKKYNVSFNIERVRKDRFTVDMFYTYKANSYQLSFGPIIVDLSLIVDTIGFFSPRKLKTCFGIRSRKPLVVFQFMSKISNFNVKTNRIYEIHNDFEYFFMHEKHFNQFRRICGLEVLEPPKIILNMECYEK